MSDDYSELRSTVCATPSELKRLREIVVNAVMATDIGKSVDHCRERRYSCIDKQEFFNSHFPVFDHAFLEADKKLKALRNDRWARAFAGDKSKRKVSEMERDAVNRKAVSSIVLFVWQF